MCKARIYQNAGKRKSVKRCLAIPQLWEWDNPHTLHTHIGTLSTYPAC